MKGWGTIEPKGRMLNSFLRPFQGNRRAVDRAAFPPPDEDDHVDMLSPGTRHEYAQHRHATADFTEADDDDDDDDDDSNDEEQRQGNGRDGDGDEGEGDDEDGVQRSTTVLPLFSASHLGIHLVPLVLEIE